MSVSRFGGGPLWESTSRMEGVVPETGRADSHSQPLPGRWGDASGPGRSDGGFIRTASSTRHRQGPRFDAQVQGGGYAWWYMDAVSDDGLHAIVVIGFIGSVFSPYYAWSNWRDPLNHCAINVALYGPRANRWAMTERGASALSQTQDCLAVGPSALIWDRDGLTIHVDEISNPLPRRLRGRIRLDPGGINETSFALDPAGRHHWQPIAPHSRVTVDFDAPALRWKGSGYFDTNVGSEPLQKGFTGWTWSRAATNHGATILYDSQPRDGAPQALALQINEHGDISRFAPPPVAQLPHSLWRVARRTRSDDGTASVMKTYEDTPFYARSQVETVLLGERTMQVHESLSLDRFANPIVRMMLPFRMPRRS